VTRNVEAVPPHTEETKLPALDVWNLQHKPASRTKKAANLSKHAARIGYVFHDMEQGHQIEGFLFKARLPESRTDNDIHVVFRFRDPCRLGRRIKAANLEATLLHEPEKGPAAAPDVQQTCPAAFGGLFDE
jgi:hypothetical protein